MKVYEPRIDKATDEAFVLLDSMLPASPIQTPVHGLDLIGAWL